MNKNNQLTMLLNKINNNIYNNNIVKNKQCVLIAISGGQDSICLFFIFIQLKNQWNWSLGIIYCNHLWQKTSFYSGLLIIRIAFIYKIPIYYAITTNKIFSEQNSRSWRYSIFYRISFFYNYQVITTGHTASDKIETILFQLMRGASSENLLCLHNNKYFIFKSNFLNNSKIKTTYIYNNFKLKKIILIKKNKTLYQVLKIPKMRSVHLDSAFLKLFNEELLLTYNCLISTFNKIDTTNLSNKPANQLNIFILVRPVLLLSRFDLQKILLFLNLPLYPDTSNEIKIYYRNRIRKQLIPTLKYFFNPRIENSFNQFSLITMNEQIYLNMLIKRLIVDFYIKDNKISRLNVTFFRNLPISIQKKLIKQFLKNCTNTVPQFSNIENILVILTKKKLLRNAENFISNLSHTDYEKEHIILNFSPKINIKISYKKHIILTTLKKEITTYKFNYKIEKISKKNFLLKNRFNFTKLTKNSSFYKNKFVNFYFKKFSLKLNQQTSLYTKLRFVSIKYSTFILNDIGSLLSEAVLYNRNFQKFMYQKKIQIQVIQLKKKFIFYPNFGILFYFSNKLTYLKK